MNIDINRWSTVHCSIALIKPSIVVLRVGEAQETTGIGLVGLYITNPFEACNDKESK